MNFSKIKLDNKMNFNIKKLRGILLFSIIYGSIFSAFALDVDRSEIQSTSNEPIVFENYSGPHAKVDTLKQIQGIGSDLATDFDLNLAKNYGDINRYYVIHAIDESEKSKLDADIFIVGKDSGVDHVRNLRHIIASYLSSAYNYDYKDAYTLATFVTVYNAVYRGKTDYFSTKYKNIVTKNLDAKKAGLALSYKEWAGNTQIVIPLSNLNGDLSSIDTSIISDKKVVESLREEDDKGLDERKNLVDIKERESELAKENAQNAQKSATKEEEKLKEEKQTLQEKARDAESAQKEADKAQQKADVAQQKADENPDDEQAQAAAENAQKEADDAQQKADDAKEEEIKQQEKVDEQKEKVDDAKKVAQEEQEKADKKQNEAQKERVDISKDQKDLIAQSIQEEKNSTYALKLINEKNLYSAIVKVNKETFEEIKTSNVKVIRNRTAFQDSNNFIAIAGENSKTGAVKLVKLDKDNLEIIQESQEIIAENSVLVQSANNYFCVISESGKFYVGKFNSDLACDAKSKVEVVSATPIFVAQEGIFVTTPNGKVILLDSNSLEQK